MVNNIISFFGPDGVGKSTLTDRLKNLGFYVFSGAGVASWPDQSWHSELIGKSIDDTKCQDDNHFKEKNRRAHQLARILAEQSDVVIDSDPLHKTLMHDYLRTKDIVFVEQRYLELSALADPQAYNDRINVLLEINDELSPDETAIELQQRLNVRGVRAPFDPSTVAESREMVIANRIIAGILASHGQKIVTINTQRPISDCEPTRSISVTANA